MPDNVPRPQPLELSAEGWKRFQFEWDNYLVAAELSKKPSEVKVAIFLAVCGYEAQDRFKSFVWENAEDSKDIKKVIERFKSECMPTENTIIERYKFNIRKQKTGERIKEYVAELRRLASTCKYEEVGKEDLVNQLIRDKIVVGLPEATLRTRLLEEGNSLTLEKTINMIACVEQVRVQSNLLDEKESGDKVTSVSAVKFRKGKKTQQAPKGNAQNHSGHTSTCQFCGGPDHPRYQCPAKEKKCAKCKKIGHFHRVCRNNSTLHPQKPKISSVNTIDRQEAGVCNFEIGDCVVSFLVDCGAEVNVIPLGLYKQVTGDCQLQLINPPLNTSLAAYGGSDIRTIGTVELVLKLLKRPHKVKFHIASGKGDPIVGLRSSLDLGLISFGPEVEIRTSPRHITSVIPLVLRSKEEVRSYFADVFSDEVGDLRVTHHIKVNASVQPVIHAQRRVPEPIRPAVKKKLDELVAKKVLEPVTEPTEWVSSMVVVPKKDGTVRLCIDCKDLNDSICREHYTIPTYDEISSRLAGAKFFTLVDTKNGFWHIRLDKESAKRCTFNTPFGRYCWKRLPFGLKSSPEVFQKHLIQALDGLEGVLVCADDILVVGHDEHSHDRNFHALMERCRKRKIKLNGDKIQYKVSKVTYMGHTLTTQGMEPDPQKISDILKMPPPQDLSQLRGFLCTVNFLSRYLPKLATVSEPLRQLLKKNVHFTWTDSQQQAFEAIKKRVTAAPILRYYNPREVVVIQCDASQYGLGAALLQDGKPVAYASRAMTDTEKLYAQIEKELLSIVFATQRFDQFIYGLSCVTIHTDHKPLETILKKNINEAPNKRIQRMMLKLQRYALKTIYVPGRELWIADTLSRLPPLTPAKPCAFSIKLAEHQLASDLAVTPEQLQELQSTSREDLELQAVVQAVREGNWLKPGVSEYAPVKDELSTDGVLVFKGARIVIPRVLRSKTLQQLHTPHQGIEATRRRARETVYWPGLNGQISEMIKRCAVCAAIQPSQPKEPMLPHEIPSIPWLKVGMDLFELKGQDYLVMTDYTSNWFEVAEMKRITAASLIHECRVQFARHGVPQQVVTDSGTQFTSAEFKSFAEKWNFEIISSSPHYHQSNGKAENAVKTLKRLLKKSEIGDTDPLLAILEWRNTPSEATGTSPAQGLFGRRCRTPIPVSLSKLQPEIQHNEDGLVEAKKKQEYHYNRTAHPLQPLSVGQQINLQVPGSTNWVPGMVTKALKYRSYLVESGGRTFKRNRRHLRPSLLRPQADATPLSSPRAGTLTEAQRGEATSSLDTPKSTQAYRGEVPVRPPRRLDFADSPPLPPTRMCASPSQPLRRSLRESRPPDRYGP